MSEKGERQEISFPLSIFSPPLWHWISLFVLHYRTILLHLDQIHKHIDGEFHLFPLDDARVFVVKAISAASEELFLETRDKQEMFAESLEKQKNTNIWCAFKFRPDGNLKKRFKKPQLESNKMYKKEQFEKWKMRTRHFWLRSFKLQPRMWRIILHRR